MDDAYSPENMEYEYEDEELVSWITWFCDLKGNEFFCMVDREFITDDFNLTGLAPIVPFYHYALELILDVESMESDGLTEQQKRLVESSAEILYGLIHARFITTGRGLKLMEEKYVQGEFGSCPRVFCEGHALLPVGQSDVVRESSVKLFCPRCEDIYHPRSNRHRSLDGAFWGTTFPHLLLMQLRERGVSIPPPNQQYVPKVYGFRIRKPGTTLITNATGEEETGTASAGAGDVSLKTEAGAHHREEEGAVAGSTAADHRRTVESSTSTSSKGKPE
ncbi:putative Casein kinase II regulatory subunit [Leishmania shawi]|uniref:Casein kinase II subunit beta n=1 Tax=Leishmania shawi TaxID=5680 RepID=A0AAW3B552_9TRYP